MKLCRYVLLITIAAFLFSCGGSTSGTDSGGTLKFQGMLLSSSAQPLADAEITVTETGDSAVSASDGSFTIETASRSKAEFLIEKDGNVSHVVAEQLPANQGEIYIVIEVDLSNGTASILSITVTPIPTATLAPSSTDAPAATPRPSEFSILDGTIVNKKRGPVEGARVQITGVSGSSLTSRDGRFSLKFPSGQPSIEIVIRKDRTGRVTLSGLPAYSVHVTLTIEANIEPRDPNEPRVRPKITIVGKRIVPR